MAVKGTHARLGLFALLLGGFVALLLIVIGGPRDAASVERARVAPPAPETEDEAPAPTALEPVATPEATPTPEPEVELPPPESKPACNGPPRVLGRVTDPNGVPLSGARVTVEFRPAEDSDARSGQADFDGRYEIVLVGYDRTSDMQLGVSRELRELSRELQRVQARNATQKRQLERRLARLDASADAPIELAVGVMLEGYGFGEDRRKVGLPVPRETVVDFVLTPGSILSGFVVDKRDGSKVAGATVELLDASFSVLGATETDERGAWGLNLANAGVYQLFARHESVGTGLISKLELQPTFIQLAPDIFLVGDGTLDGRVAYLDGRPAAQLVLEARHDSLLFLQSGALSETERIQRERDVGLVIAEATTDARGEFHFEGLQPGRFALHFTDVGDSSLQPPLLYNAPERDIVLVFAGHRLRAAVRQRGTPVGAPWITCDKLVREGEGWRSERVGSWRGVGDWYRDVEVGARYLVRASAPGTQEDWSAVTIAETPAETVVALDLWAESESAPGGHSSTPGVAGRIEVDVTDSGQRALGGWLATLRSKESQRVVSGMNLVAPDKSGVLPPVAPGDYQLTLTCAPRGDAFALLASAPIDVTVGAGGTAKVAVQGQLGARLKFLTRADAAAKGDKAVQLTASICRRDAKDAAGMPLVFVAPTPANALARGKLLLGGSALCEPLFEPGEYRVVIERDGGPPERRDVKLEAGKVFEFELAEQ